MADSWLARGPWPGVAVLQQKLISVQNLQWEIKKAEKHEAIRNERFLDKLDLLF